ncbi:MAG: hypothetical protein WCA22_11865 [Candidatus Binatus sp.]
MSKNSITIDQLKLACRHVNEMIHAGVRENLAIRTLELFADKYAKLKKLKKTGPNNVNQVKLWSIKARNLLDAKPDAKPRDYFRVEHGMPRRGFARKIRELEKRHQLNTETMNKLVERFTNLL